MNQQQIAEPTIFLFVTGEIISQAIAKVSEYERRPHALTNMSLLGFCQSNSSILEIVLEAVPLVLEALCQYFVFANDHQAETAAPWASTPLGQANIRRHLEP